EAGTSDSRSGGCGYGRAVAGGHAFPFHRTGTGTQPQCTHCGGQYLRHAPTDGPWRKIRSPKPPDSVIESMQSRLDPSRDKGNAAPGAFVILLRAPARLSCWRPLAALLHADTPRRQAGRSPRKEVGAFSEGAQSRAFTNSPAGARARCSPALQALFAGGEPTGMAPARGRSRAQRRGAASLPESPAATPHAARSRQARRLDSGDHSKYDLPRAQTAGAAALAEVELATAPAARRLGARDGGARFSPGGAGAHRSVASQGAHCLQPALRRRQNGAGNRDALRLLGGHDQTPLERCAGALRAPRLRSS